MDEVTKKIGPMTASIVGFETRPYVYGRHFERSLYRCSLAKLRPYRTVLSGPSRCVSMSFSCNGRQLVKSNGSTTASILDPRMAQTSMELGSLEFEPAIASTDRERYNLCLFSSTDSTRLFTSSSKGSHNIIKLWDLRNTRQQLSSLCTNLGTIVTLNHLKSHGWLLYGHQEGAVCCWDVETAVKAGEKTDGIRLDHELLNVEGFVELDLDATETKMLLILRNGKILFLENLDFPKLRSQLTKAQIAASVSNGGYDHWGTNQGHQKHTSNQMFTISPTSYLINGQSSISSIASVNFVQDSYEGGISVIAKVTVQPHKNTMVCPSSNPEATDSQSKSTFRASFTGPALPNVSGPAVNHRQNSFQRRTTFTSGPLVPSSRTNPGSPKPMFSGPLLPKTRNASSLFSPSAAKKPCRESMCGVSSGLDFSEGSGSNDSGFVDRPYSQPNASSNPLFLGRKMPSSMEHSDSAQVLSAPLQSPAWNQQCGGPASSSSLQPGFSKIAAGFKLPNHSGGCGNRLTPNSQQLPSHIALPMSQYNSKKDLILQIAIDSGKSQFSILDINSSNTNNVLTKWYDIDDSYKPLSRKRISLCSQVLASPSSKGIKVYMLPTMVYEMDKDFLFSGPKQLDCMTEVAIKQRSVLACCTSPTEEILGKIHEAGFEIAMTKEVELSKEDAGHFYSGHREQDFFDSLTTHMSSGPFLVLALAREDAVEGWRDLLGPKVIEEAKEKAPDSLRSQFSEEGLEINPLHGSSDLEAASNELEFFFPTEQTVAVIKPNAFSERETIVKKIEEAGFSVSMSRETQLTKEQIEQLYSEHKDKDFFGDLSEFMSSGPSLFMVLSRAEAIQGWRAMMGPVDPSEAKEQEQASLRALFGVDKIQNAVHGTSSKEKAQELIKEFFGEPEPDQPQEVAGD